MTHVQRWWTFPATFFGQWNRATRERVQLLMVVCLALLQGWLYVLLLPPWQHYDEPTHFEYAWLIANRGRLPLEREADQWMRRETAASMLEHNFFAGMAAPPLIVDHTPISIGVTELTHPPAYYLLLSAPLRFVRHLPMTAQLYVGRGISLILFVLTILTCAGIARELTPPGHTLRWVLPLTATFLAPFVDLMTAVNNDVGAVLAFSLFLWGAVRVLGHGLSLWGVLWLVGAALVAPFFKNTAALATLLAPIVLLTAFWRQRGWAWRWYALTLGVLLISFMVVISEWNDAAAWYRRREATVLDHPTRAVNTDAPVGANTVVLSTGADNQQTQLISPIYQADAREIAGQSITVGGWLWADQPTTIQGIGVVHGANGSPQLINHVQPISLTTTPRFAAFTFELPPETGVVHYAFFGGVVEGAVPQRIYLNAATITVGAFPTNAAPAFDDASARAGEWGGKRFTNLVRNPSGAQAGPRLRPWVERLLVRYAKRSPSQALTALFDVGYTGRFLLTDVIPWVFQGFFTTFAWGHVRLPGQGWPYLFLGIVLVAVAGGLLWARRSIGKTPPGLLPALVFLLITGLLVGANTLLRALPVLHASSFIPGARYAFPAILPFTLLLAGGWWAVWPRRLRPFGATLLLTILVGLNIVSIWTIWSYYQNVIT